jgi:hypothetical protein
MFTNFDWMLVFGNDRHRKGVGLVLKSILTLVVTMYTVQDEIRDEIA